MLKKIKKDFIVKDLRLWLHLNFSWLKIYFCFQTKYHFNLKLTLKYFILHSKWLLYGHILSLVVEEEYHLTAYELWCSKFKNKPFPILFLHSDILIAK